MKVLYRNSLLWIIAFSGLISCSNQRQQGQSEAKSERKSATVAKTEHTPVIRDAAEASANIAPNFSPTRYVLLQNIWQGEEGWFREVPIINGKIAWDQPDDWQGPIGAGGFPVDAPVRALDGFNVGGFHVQVIWLGDQGWSRKVPIQNGDVQWTKAGEWEGPVLKSDIPGQGEVEALTNVVVGTNLVQSLWRGGEGWHRTQAITDGWVQWDKKGEWEGPIGSDGLEGEGDFNTLSTIISNDVYIQAYWRGDQGWVREVPIENGETQWSKARPWQGPLEQQALPGNGPIVAQADVIIPKTEDEGEPGASQDNTQEPPKPKDEDAQDNEEKGDSDTGHVANGLDLTGCKLSAIEAEAIKEIFQHSNQERIKMKCDPVLHQVARERAMDLATRRYFEHVNPDGEGPNYLVREAGYPLPYYYSEAKNSNNIESLGAGFLDPKDMIKGWAESETHAKHIFGQNDFYRQQDEVAIAFYEDPNSEYLRYWVILTAERGR